MRGSVRKRGNTYTWYLFTPDPVTGQGRQHTKGGYRTKKECQAALNDAQADLAHPVGVVSVSVVVPVKRPTKSVMIVFGFACVPPIGSWAITMPSWVWSSVSSIPPRASWSRSPRVVAGRASPRPEASSTPTTSACSRRRPGRCT